MIAHHTVTDFDRDRTRDRLVIESICSGNQSAQFAPRPGFEAGVAKTFLALARSHCSMLPVDGELDRFVELWNDEGTAFDAEFYDENAASFNRLFFAKNLLKCLIAASALPTTWLNDAILADLGAGAGPMTLACNAVQNIRHSLLVDRSLSQHGLAKRYLGLPGQKLHYSTFVVHAPDFVSLDPNVAVCASYLFSEIDLLNTKWLDYLVAAGKFLIVDSPDTIADLTRALPSHMIEISETVSFTVDGTIADYVEGSGGRFGYITGNGEGSRR